MTAAVGSQDSMISRLRRKIFVTHVAFAAIALVVVGLVIVFVDYQQQERAVYEALSHALELDDRQGVNSGEEGGPIGGHLGGIEPRGEDDLGSWAGQGAPDAYIATSVYVVASDSVAEEHINALSLDSAASQQALGVVMTRMPDGDCEARGVISSLGLYYCAAASPDGTTKVAFASESYVKQTTGQLVRSLLLAGGLALVGFSGISVLLARWSVRPVELAWRQQQQFVADASHELKTPLAVILANNSLIMSDPQASVASQMQWVESTETEAHLMQDLVNDMLYLAKSEFEQREEECGQVDFSDIVEGSALQFESVAFERNVTITDDIAEGLFVTGDASRLQRLVGTLVDNACKYADEGGTVRVELVSVGQDCRLRVANSGAVIDPEDLPHLFDRFYRSDKARTRGTGGFGLGLAIAKGIVDEHGGRISVTSTEAEGTIFTVTIPLA